MPDAKPNDSIAARQCWECFKRRLVCDRTLPLCRKCTKTGKECPGYNDQKPLQWVEPGHVTIRPKKNKNKECRPPTSAIRAANSDRLAPVIPNGPVAGPAVSRDACLPELLGQGGCSWPVSEELELTPEAIGLSESQLANLLVQEDKPAWWRDSGIKQQVDPIEPLAAEARVGCGVGERIMCIGNKDQIKEVVERGLHWEAALLLQSNQRPLAKIQRLLQIMEMNRLPSYDFLSDETHDVVQAVNYCMYSNPGETQTCAKPPSQLQDISGYRRNRLPSTQPSSGSFPSVGIAYIGSGDALYYCLPESQLLLDLVTCEQRPCHHCRQPPQDIPLSRPCYTRSQRECREKGNAQ